MIQDTFALHESVRGPGDAGTDWAESYIPPAGSAMIAAPAPA